MKQLCRMVNYPNLLLNKIYKARYLKDGNPLSVQPKPTDSFVCKSLCSVMQIISSGLTEGDNRHPFKWKFSADNNFNVKSGYELALQWKISKTSYGDESSRSQICTKAWGIVWKLKIPDRIKIFAWRLYHDALPIFSNLRRRGCKTEMKCYQCGFKEESTKHILLKKCWWSTSFWKNLKIGWPENNDSSPADWLWHFMTDRSKDELKIIINGAWLI